MPTLSEPELVQKKCKPCEGGVEPVSGAEAKQEITFSSCPKSLLRLGLWRNWTKATGDLLFTERAIAPSGPLATRLFLGERSCAAVKRADNFTSKTSKPAGCWLLTSPL